MKIESHDSWSLILLRHINLWRKRDGLSREAAAVAIVEAYIHVGEPPVGGEFRQSKDAYEDARINAQRIFRWLDDQTKDCTLLPANFVPVILQALPEDLRLRAAHALLAPLALSIAPMPAAPAEGCRVSFSHTLSRLCKEPGEALASIATLTDGIDPGELEVARRELQDLLSIGQSALQQVEQEIAK